MSMPSGARRQSAAPHTHCPPGTGPGKQDPGQAGEGLRMNSTRGVKHVPGTQAAGRCPSFCPPVPSSEDTPASTLEV